MSTQKSPVPARVTTWVEGWITSVSSQGSASIEPLAGDGSTRQFFRVFVQSKTGQTKGGQKSWVLLSDAGWISSKDYAPHQLYLRKIGVPVPDFHKVDPKDGFLVMEDLGDEFLQERMRRSEKSLPWLESATRLLAQLHGKAFPVPAELPVASRRFDAQKYFDELCFTGEHLVVGFLKQAAWNERQRTAIRKFCEEIASVPPDFFCHRDYHTRNLMVRESELFMIDFQDARLGPPQYDLASILYDAYVPVSDEERRRLLVVYREELAKHKAAHAAVRWETFERDLARIAVQRTVKAAGSFASFFTRYGKRTHLPYLIPCLHTSLSLLQACFKNGDPLLEALDVANWIEGAKRLVVA